MNCIEFGRNTLPCGTLVYSYKRCTGGYLVNIHNLDTDKTCTTVGIDIPRMYMLEILERMVADGITTETMNSFLTEEVNKYFTKFPAKPAPVKSSYLYL